MLFASLIGTHLQPIQGRLSANAAAQCACQLLQCELLITYQLWNVQ